MDSTLVLDCHNTEGSSLFPLQISNNIVLTAAGELDREERETYNLRCFFSGVSNSESSICDIFDFILHVRDVNDNGPVFSQDTYTISMFETDISDVYRVKIAETPIVSDNDAGLNSEYEIQLFDSNLTEQTVFNLITESNLFGIYLIQNAERLDREIINTYNLTLVANDVVNSTLTATAQLKVEIMDSNDNSPEIKNLSIIIKIREDALSGTKFGYVYAEDMDVYPNNQINYYLSTSCVYTTNSISTLLLINPDTGDITLKESIDADILNILTLNIQVVAIDPTDTNRFDCVDLKVEIIDINDNSPEIQITIEAESVEEESIGLTIARILTMDLDSSANGIVNLTFTCENITNCAQNFELEELAPGVYNFKLEQPLDYELATGVAITFYYKDNGNSPRNGSYAFNLTITPLNEYWPVFSNSTYSCTVREDLTEGKSFCTEAIATDKDAGEDGQITYCIHTDTAIPSIEVVNEYFAFSYVTNSLVLLKEFDFESLSSNETKYFFQLNASNVDGTKYSIANISLEVIDVNDNAPKVEPIDQDYMISEDVPSGFIVFHFSVVDVDSGENSRLTFTLQPAMVPFIVEYSNEGWSLVTNDILDRESNSSYSLKLVATDNGDPPLESEIQAFNINILDVNDNRPYFEYSSYTFTLRMGNDTWGVPVSDKDSEIIADIRLDFHGNSQLDKALIFDEITRHIVLENPSAISDGFYEITVYVSDPSLSLEETAARCTLDYRPDGTYPTDGEISLAPVIAGVGLSILLLLILIVIVSIVCLTIFAVRRRVGNIKYQPQIQHRKKRTSAINPSSILKPSTKFSEGNNSKKVSFNGNVQLMTFKGSSSESAFTTSDISNEEQGNQWQNANRDAHNGHNDPEAWLDTSQYRYQQQGHRQAVSTSTSSELSQGIESKDSNAPLIDPKHGYFHDTRVISNPHTYQNNNNMNTVQAGYSDCYANRVSSTDESDDQMATTRYDPADIMPDVLDSETTDDSERPPYGAVPIYISSDMTSEGDLSTGLYSDNDTNISNQAQYCMTNIPSDSYDGELTL
ncbi:protocadherin gamma-A4-like [Oopsacas minuta]|uniref:Protocadherin gamma-A4-like n=1 Tax=Oopsacas minuta TaxID=111878 RepID=A0AAV7JQ72_9METZ|nr:protocadherin gamma-A4-like [Oopsacas minuta]